jgi:hypothetical protein
MKGASAALDSFCPPPNSIFRPYQQTDVVHESLTFLWLESARIANVIVAFAECDFKVDIHRNFEICQLLSHLVTLEE